MKVKAECLKSNLLAQTYPCYLISGEEEILVQDCCQMVRQHCASLNYETEAIFYVEPGFKWVDFLDAIHNSSLFAEKKLVELRVLSSLGEAGNRVLQSYLSRPAAQTVLLITLGKLDSVQQRNSWFKLLDQVGVIVQVWSLDKSGFQGWLRARFRQASLRVDATGLEFLTNYFAGNLAAAVQEIEKLSLLYGTGTVGLEQLQGVVTDQARFNVFNLVDRMLAGNRLEMNRILEALERERVEPVIVLWGIVNELRTLIKIRVGLDQGGVVDQLLTKSGVFYSKKPLIKRVIVKLELGFLYGLLQEAAHVDLIIKGVERERLVWHALAYIYNSLCSKCCYIL